MTRFLTVFVVAGAAISLAQTASAQDASAPSKAEAMFAQVDTNHDSAISLEEWKAAGRRERGYGMVDANHDGRVTLDELRTAAAARGQ